MRATAKVRHVPQHPRTFPGPISVLANRVALAAGLLCLPLVWLGIEIDLRPVLVFVLWTLGPGSGVARCLRINDPALELTLIIGVSAGTGVAVAQAQLWLGSIAPLSGTIVMLAITAIGLTTSVARDGGHRH